MISNQMTELLNKIERRLGVTSLNLPDHLKKDTWAKVIAEDTLQTFSRFFPRCVNISIDPKSKKTVDGYYVIDDDAIPEGLKILGIKDIDWELFAQDSIRLQQSQGYGIYDFLSNNYGLDDAMLLQMRADHLSLFNSGIYVDFQYPNKVKLVSVTGAEVCRDLLAIPLKVFVTHAENLMTIAPTKMETFEALAIADIARYLHTGLKYFDGIETVYANIDLKLSDLENEASKREEIVNILRDGYVSAANDDQPIIITV